MNRVRVRSCRFSKRADKTPPHPRASSHQCRRARMIYRPAIYLGSGEDVTEISPHALIAIDSIHPCKHRNNLYSLSNAKLVLTDQSIRCTDPMYHRQIAVTATGRDAYEVIEIDATLDTSSMRINSLMRFPITIPIDDLSLLWGVRFHFENWYWCKRRRIRFTMWGTW